MDGVDNVGYELVIVVLVGYIVVPKLTNFLNIWELNTEVEKTIASLKEARARAIIEGVGYRIYISSDGTVLCMKKADYLRFPVL